jgi:uncharacterized protein DUF4352
VAVLATVAALSGCSLAPKKPKSIPPPPNTDTSPDQGGVGTPITLRGETTELEVRVTGVLDPVSGSPADTTLSPNARFVGVRLTLRNIGQGTYSESPLEDSKLLTRNGAPTHPVNLLGGPCGGRFPLQVHLRPGQRTEGCLPYEVSRSEEPARFQFALDSGFAPEVGTWRLG